MCITHRVFHRCEHCSALKMISSEPTICEDRQAQLDQDVFFEMDLIAGPVCTRMIVPSTKFDVAQADCRRCSEAAERRRLQSEADQKAEDEMVALEEQRERMLARLEAEKKKRDEAGGSKDKSD